MSDSPAQQTPQVSAEAAARTRYTGHPWRSLLVIISAQAMIYLLASSVLRGVFHLPVDISNPDDTASIAIFTVSNITAYLILPYLMGIPNGKRSIRDFLADIGIINPQPVLRLMALTASCLIILFLCQGAGSIVYRLAQGNSVTLPFLVKVFDLSSALPPKSILIFAVFYSAFEEVGFRGVLLTMLLGIYSSRRAILYSAIAFGLMHMFAMLAGRSLVLTLGQVVWAFIFALFYGYLFVRTGSLLPPMIVHWLSNVFQGPLTAYWPSTPESLHAVYGIIFGYGIATVILIFWVRYFSSRWLEVPHTLQLRAPPSANSP